MRITYKPILVFSLIILSILSYQISTKKIKGDISLPEPNLEFNFHSDIIYNDNGLRLDIYQPKKTQQTKSPVVIYVHGGGWDKGDKTMIRKNFRGYILEELLNNGYTIISMNYTLLDQKTHLDQPLQDIKDVKKWIRENSEKYNLDFSNMGIWGGSAGAHIALVSTYSQDKNEEKPTGLKYVVDFYGPTDLNKLFKTDANSLSLNFFKLYSPERLKIRNEKIIKLTGFNITDQKEKVIKKSTEYSPITYISKSTVPTLIFHGTEDTAVSITQSQELEEALKSNKVPYQFYTIDNAKHNFGNIGLKETRDVSRKTVDFIKSHTKYEN